MSTTQGRKVSKDGIDWYYEQKGSGPHLVLIPSGEGDCQAYHTIMATLASDFTVTSFDMPGMSRTTAPASALENITPALLAKQIIGLMDELNIEVATYYGCSSGALAVLALVANHADRVRNGIVHEAPFGKTENLTALKELSDAEIVAQCRDVFATFMNEDTKAWEGLGSEYHARLDKNYVTWVRTYVNQVNLVSPIQSEVKRRPVDWTIGALTIAGLFFNNIVFAVEAGIPIGLLPSRHFPQVSIPDVLAAHIKATASKYL